MKSIILLSGGLDSAVNLALAKEQTVVELALTIAYCQKAERKEILASQQLAKYYQVPHQVVKLDFFKDLGQSGLIAPDMRVPLFDNPELLTEESAAQVWVPNRNGLFINIAASFAESLNIEMIVTGFNQEEAATFPDNSRNFVTAINQSLTYSTRNYVFVHSFTQDMNKNEIGAIGHRLKVPFELVWSCYLGNDSPCGECESCLRYKRALEIQT
ncbi:MAG: 7-cyano-7-deazaguanine synthase QueC [Clostridia bacterium]|jgi:7-cyano-7-deazaguanine synthase|nr:7-cyano-7-deazaguanine synthase QueC [Clostridia bacterium]